MQSARAQVLAAAVMFGTTGTAQALGPEGSTPSTVGALRILVGGALLLALAAVGGGLRGRWPWPLVLSAGIGVAVYQVAFFEAVDRTGVGVGAVVAIGTGPVIAGVLERVLDGVWPGGRWALATACAAAGVAVLTLGAAEGTELAVDGIALAVVSGLGYAGYTVVAKRLLRRGHGPIQVMAMAFGIGGVLLLPALALGPTAWLTTPRGLALVLYLGIVPTALAYLLFARGLRRLSAAEVTTLVLVEPVTALVLGALVLDEHVGLVGAAGSALVLLGLALLALPRRAASDRVVEAAP